MPPGDPPEKLAPIFVFLASDLAGRRYKGSVINQLLLFELIPDIKKEIVGKEYNLKEILNSMKSKLNPHMVDLFKKNEDLIDFLLKYE